MSKSFKANRQDDSNTNYRKGHRRQRRDKFRQFTSRNIEPSCSDIYIASEMHDDVPFDDLDDSFFTAEE